jgi:hypothetical protein
MARQRPLDLSQELKSEVIHFLKLDREYIIADTSQAKGGKQGGCWPTSYEHSQSEMIQGVKFFANLNGSNKHPQKLPTVWLIWPAPVDIKYQTILRHIHNSTELNKVGKWLNLQYLNEKRWGITMK